MSLSPPGVAAGSDQDRILILDFGSQYSQLIARRVREAGVYSELFPWDVSPEKVVDFRASGIILSGGPESVHGKDAPKAPEEVFSLGVPVLGICYGMQTMAGQLGGVVVPASHREYGYAQVRARGHSSLLRDIEDHRTPEGYGLLDVWMSHGDRVESLPPRFRVIAETLSAPLAGMADEERRFYGLQFHPEVTHTSQGKQIIERFEQLKIERWKIAQTLKAACAQRLIKVLCPDCKVQIDGVEETDRRLFNLGDEWAERALFVARPGGCSECRETGYSGRTAILEIIPITPRVSDQLSKGEISPYDLEMMVLNDGTLPNLRKSGLRLLADGQTDLKAVSKTIDMTYSDE